MSLLIRGSVFWGEFQVRGKRLRLSLETKVEGKVPKPLSEQGDRAFEQARAKAWVAHDELLKELTDPSRSVRRLEKIEEIVSGESTRVVAPNEMYALWLTAPRSKKLDSERHRSQVESLLGKFIDFLKRRHPAIRDIRQISFSIALEFTQDVPAAMTGGAYNNRLITLRAAYNAAAAHTRVRENPFKKIPKRDTDGERVVPPPYTPEELARILEKAAEDDLVGPVVTTAICTGMRRADCAHLRWEKVNLETGMINCAAHKTKSALMIPILPPLRKVLEKMPTRAAACFPASSALFTTNPDGLNLLLEKMLKLAGITVKSLVEADAKHRLRGRTDSGFHRFKATFVTLALTAGVSVELLQKIVGNKDLNVLLKHYHRPAAETLKHELSSKMPTVFGGRINSPSSWLHTLRAMLASADGSSWDATRTRALALMDAQMNLRLGPPES